MAGLKYYAIVGDPMTMSRDELCAQLGGADHAKIMRSLLMREVERVKAGEQTESRTMRNVWYKRIKPVLSKLGVLNQQTRSGNEVDWPRRMSESLGELVDAGVTSYGELMIVDASRSRRNPTGMVLPVADVPVVGAHYPGIILFTEKDTIYGEVEDLASIYGLSALSGGGQPSKAATEDLVRQIVECENFRTGSNIYVLSLTDFDPAGYSIAGAVATQVELSAGLFPQVARVVHRRLGLTPNQMAPAEVMANRYEPKDKGLEEWVKQTGGVNGEPFGLELDALSFDALRQLFVDGIEDLIPDEKLYHEDLGRALVEQMIWDALMPTFDAMRREMYAAIDGDTIVTNLKCRPDTVRRFALAGFDCINPVAHDAHVFDSAGVVRRLIDDYKAVSK